MYGVLHVLSGRCRGCMGVTSVYSHLLFHRAATHPPNLQAAASTDRYPSPRPGIFQQPVSKPTRQFSPGHLHPLNFPSLRECLRSRALSFIPSHSCTFHLDRACQLLSFRKRLIIITSLRSLVCSISNKRDSSSLTFFGQPIPRSSKLSSPYKCIPSKSSSPQSHEQARNLPFQFQVACDISLFNSVSTNHRLPSYSVIAHTDSLTETS